jgi:DNA-binding MarR family transcriptional regulator
MDASRYAWRMIELLPKVLRGFARNEHNYLSRGKLSLPQLWALDYIFSNRVCVMSSLADDLGISRPAATSLVSRLFAQGLVVRKPDRRDRRIVRIDLTPKGVRAISDIRAQKHRIYEYVYGKLPSRDLKQYMRTLERIVEILAKDKKIEK